MYRQGVNAADKQIGQGSIDHAVPFKATFAGKARRYDFYPKVRLAAFGRTRMSCVQMRLINYRKRVGGKCCDQFFCNQFLYPHSHRLIFRI